MTVENWRALLGWGALINYGMLALWFTGFLFAHDIMYKLHSSWYGLSVETFNTVNYLCMLLFDMIVFLFFLVPWVVLLITTRRRAE